MIYAASKDITHKILQNATGKPVRHKAISQKAKPHWHWWLIMLLLLWKAAQKSAEHVWPLRATQWHLNYMKWNCVCIWVSVYIYELGCLHACAHVFVCNLSLSLSLSFSLSLSLSLLLPLPPPSLSFSLTLCKCVRLPLYLHHTLERPVPLTRCRYGSSTCCSLQGLLQSGQGIEVGHGVDVLCTGSDASQFRQIHTITHTHG